MRLSTRSRYGVRAMLDLALAGGKGPVNLQEIASRQDISADYLEQLLRKLRRAGLVRSIRGPRGGFVLARPAREITVWQIVAALEQDVAPVRCVNEEVGRQPPPRPCPRVSGCATHLLWRAVARRLRSFLENRTLQDLAEDAAKICETAAPGQPIMFYI